KSVSTSESAVAPACSSVPSAGRATATPETMKGPANCDAAIAGTSRGWAWLGVIGQAKAWSLEKQRHTAQEERGAHDALKGGLAQARVDLVADEEAEAHGRNRRGAEDEGVERQLVHRGIADGARDAQGQQHGGEGGAEGLLVRAARIEVHGEEDRGHGAEERADGAGEEARDRAEQRGRHRR